MSGWIGVDLDGTLAHYDGWVSELHIGPPIGTMLFRVKKWLAEGRDVRIFTARVGHEVNKDGSKHDASGVRLAIEQWCLEHVGKVLPITCVKDYGMVELWDDRAIQVEQNTGRRMDGKP